MFFLIDIVFKCRTTHIFHCNTSHVFIWAEEKFIPCSLAPTKKTKTQQNKIPWNMLLCASCSKLFVGIGFMFGQKVESLRYRPKKHLTVKKIKILTQVSLYPNVTDSFSDNTISLPYSHPVPNVLTGHQWLQVVSSHVVRRPLIDLLRHPLQEPNRNISAAQEKRYFIFTLNVLHAHHIKASMVAPLPTCTWRRATPAWSGVSFLRLECQSPSAPNQSWWNPWGCPGVRWTRCPSVCSP